MQNITSTHQRPPVTASIGGPQLDPTTAFILSQQNGPFYLPNPLLQQGSLPLVQQPLMFQRPPLSFVPGLPLSSIAPQQQLLLAPNGQILINPQAVQVINSCIFVNNFYCCLM